MFCNIIDILIVHFDQFNASLLNKSLLNFKKNKTSRIWNWNLKKKISNFNAHYNFYMGLSIVQRSFLHHWNCPATFKKWNKPLEILNVYEHSQIPLALFFSHYIHGSSRRSNVNNSWTQTWGWNCKEAGWKGGIMLLRVGFFWMHNGS